MVLASGSPRRRELLSGQGLTFRVIRPVFPEDLGSDAQRWMAAAEGRPGGGAGAYASATAREKAREVARGLGVEGGPTLVLAADTVVEVDGVVLEKPADAAEAEAMLMCLSGRSHRVHTGCALYSRGHTPDREAIWRSAFPRPASRDATPWPDATTAPGGGWAEVDAWWESTEVRFGDLDAAIVRAYAASGDPLDKAGGYGIQGPAGAFVEGVDGCYWNVVGLPLHRVCLRLAACV